MKKELLIFCFAFWGMFSFGQSMHKGNVLAIHILKINLKPGVKMSDYENYSVSTAIPAFEKNFLGAKLYFIKSLRGQDSNSVALMYVFNSIADQRKYFNKDGSVTKAGKVAQKNWETQAGMGFSKLIDMSKPDAPDVFNEWLIK